MQVEAIEAAETRRGGRSALPEARGILLGASRDAADDPTPRRTALMLPDGGCGVWDAPVIALDVFEQIVDGMHDSLQLNRSNQISR